MEMEKNKTNKEFKIVTKVIDDKVTWQKTTFLDVATYTHIIGNIFKVADNN